MKKLYKVAQEIEKDNKSKMSAGKLLAQSVGLLRGLAILHQQAHWTSAGNEYYGDHLLFQRLYDAVSEDIDSVAEKLAGVFDPSFLDVGYHANITKKFIDTMNTTDNLVERNLKAEKAFVTFNSKIYEKIKESGEMTLGLDDLIMSVSSKHEENIYLLQQRLRQNSNSS